MKIMGELLTRYHSVRGRLDDAGATAVEYSLLIALIAAVILAAVKILGLKLIPGFSSVSSQL